MSRLLRCLAVVALVGACRRSPSPSAGATPNLIRNAGLAGPAAVLHDPDRDRYLVSNVNGSLDVADNNGFVSLLSTEGDTLKSHWIAGGLHGVTLNAPTGMAVSGSYLFVADISIIRRFDRRSGAPSGEFQIPGAARLCGMASTSQGMLYFTDSGTPVGGNDSLPSPNEAVYRLAPDGHLDTLMRGPELGHPTGIAASGDSVWVVNRRGELYRIEGGKRVEIVRLPKPGATGLVVFAGDAFISTSDGPELFRGKLGGPFQPLVSGLGPAGSIGHDDWRNRILVPLTRDNAVQVVRLAF